MKGLVLALGFFVTTAFAQSTEIRDSNSIWWWFNPISNAKTTEYEPSEIKELTKQFELKAGTEVMLPLGVNVAFVKTKTTKVLQGSKITFYRNRLGRNYEAMILKIYPKVNGKKLKVRAYFTYEHSKLMYQDLRSGLIEGPSFAAEVDFRDYMESRIEELLETVAL
ncbi:MAG: hypothetical protein OHK0056_17080 [Bacteriovoracaceae bacterium]